jgi:hypothetical protein
MNLIEQVVPAAARPSVLGWIVIAMAVVGGIFATGGLVVFEQVFPVEPDFEGSARASLFLCGASVVAFVLSLYRFLFFRGKPALNLTIPKRLNTPLGFALCMFIGWLIGTTVFR